VYDSNVSFNFDFDHQDMSFIGDAVALNFSFNVFFSPGTYRSVYTRRYAWRGWRWWWWEGGGEGMEGGNFSGIH